jgi:DNA-binding LytR/AlgR family response regulator
MMYKAIIADDEEELRIYLISLLSETWPELIICGEATNGEEAITLIESEQPQVAFLDIKMPGLTGMDVAGKIGGICRIVFVTAFDQYAMEAFEREAVDYLLKPVSKTRLIRTVARLKRQLDTSPVPPPKLAEAVEKLLARLPERGGPDYLRWIKTQHRDDVLLIPVKEVDYFRAKDKYTLVMTKEGESLIRKSIKELAGELDPGQFWQIHRGIIVNVSRIDKVSRSLGGQGTLRLKERSELLTVSHNYLQLFKHM